MSKALTVREDDPIAVGEVLAASGYFTDARDAAKAATKVMAGRELGLGPVASMTGVHIIQGKPSLGANLLAALVKRHPRYDYKVKELSDTECVLTFIENGEEAGESKFTMDDAAKAGVAHKKNWKTYPRNMLFARAISNGVTFYCPDLTAGAPVYTPEELGAEVNGATGEVIEGTVVEQVEVAQPVAEEPKQTVKLATPAQRRLIFANARTVGMEEADLRALVKHVAGTPHTDRIPAARVDELLSLINQDEPKTKEAA